MGHHISRQRFIFSKQDSYWCRHGKGGLFSVKEMLGIPKWFPKIILQDNGMLFGNYFEIPNIVPFVKRLFTGSNNIVDKQIDKLRKMHEIWM